MILRIVIYCQSLSYTKHNQIHLLKVIPLYPLPTFHLWIYDQAIYIETYNKF